MGEPAVTDVFRFVGILAVGAGRHPADFFGRDELDGEPAVGFQAGGAQPFHARGHAVGEVPGAVRRGARRFRAEALGGGFVEQAAGMAGIDDDDHLDAGAEGGEIGGEFVFGVARVVGAEVDGGLGGVVVAAVAGVEIDDAVARDGLGGVVGEGEADVGLRARGVGAQDGVAGAPAAALEDQVGAQADRVRHAVVQPVVRRNVGRIVLVQAHENAVVRGGCGGASPQQDPQKCAPRDFVHAVAPLLKGNPTPSGKVLPPKKGRRRYWALTELRSASPPEPPGSPSAP